MINHCFAGPLSPARLILAFCLVVLASSVYAQEEAEQPEADKLPVPGELIDFERDVKPILETHCLACHGPEDEKAGFRIDDEDYVFGYVEAGDLESSSLWVDYLVTDDPDLRMPPAKEPGQQPGLSVNELAVIKLWIEEGAKWAPWESQIDTVLEEETVVAAVSDAPLASRIWIFQGLFHPASVHFPIALLMISGIFVFFSLFSRDTFQPAAFHCLWIGAVAAVASCVMGWAYAVHEGYGAGIGFDLRNSAIDRHRWLGIAVAVGGLLLIPIARSAVKRESFNGRLLWLLGGIVLVAGVSITGYQGGELTYGEDHYGKEFERLFPEYASGTNTQETVEAEDSPDSDSTADDAADQNQTTESEPEAETEASEADSEAGNEKEPEVVQESVATPDDATEADESDQSKQ